MNRNAVQPSLVDDIVWSVWKHIVGENPNTRLTNLYQHKRSEYNSVLWNSGVESQKEQARKQKRRLHYISNIYIVHDSAEPANNGKVMLFKYGKKIFDKINDLMNPQFQDEKPVNPFDMWEGANFKLKIRTVEGYPNYEKSEFDNPGPLASDDEMEKIYSQVIALEKFVDPSRFKSYDELKTKLHRVLGISTSSSSVTQKASVRKNIEEDDNEESAPWTNNTINEEEDDEFEFFKKLASN